MKQVIIISTFADDILLGTENIIQEGGPAFFISNFLQKKGIDYKLYTGVKGKVEIDMKEEKGRIINVGRIAIPNIISRGPILISTLLDEFELKALDGFCCLDIQGYVRDGNEFGKKKYFDSPELERFDIVKATEEEIRYIPEERARRIKLLLITKGSRGCEIMQDGKKFCFPVENIDVVDTIGAGDTFFAAFCMKYYATRDIAESSEYAIKNTRDFLMEKIKTYGGENMNKEEYNMRKLQIGVMGSAADLKYSKNIEKLAEEIGKLIAKSGNITVYGAEKDYDSLSTAAARGAKKAGGLTIGVTYGKGKDIYDKKYTDVIIATGLERGGGREFVLVNSCDAIIAICGGSGTLTELAIAYQSNIPMIALVGSGGWADKLADQYFDDRKRLKVLSASTPKEAAVMAIQMAKKYSYEKL